MQIDVYGGASQTLVKSIDLDEKSMETKLLDFLLEHDLPIAYSCHGKEICKKCNVNGDILSCSHKVNEFLKKFGNKIEVSYL